VGSTLSGGLDSSFVAGLARDLRAQDGHTALPTFTMVYEAPPGGERRWADLMVAAGSLDPCFVAGDGLDPLEGVERALRDQGELRLFPTGFVHPPLLDAARERGVRVLLDGLDGDGVVGHGLARLADLVRSGHPVTAVREASSLSRTLYATRPKTAWDVLRHHALARLAPAAAHRAYRRVRPDAHPLAGAVIAEPFAARIQLRERLAGDPRFRHPGRTEREVHVRNLEALIDARIPDLLAHMASARGIQPALPYFDRRVVELCAALPAERRLRGGLTRVVMREAMRGVVPEELRWRRDKWNIWPVLHRGLVVHGRERMEAALRDSALGEYMDVPALRRRHGRLLGHRPDDRSYRAHQETDAAALWRAVVLSTWLREQR
jgi:asparagine synthase (glutamine-hydrolysing)